MSNEAAATAANLLDTAMTRTVTTYIDAADTISAAFVAPQFQSAVDVRSKDGYGSLLKSMFAGDQVAEKHLAVSERQAEILEGIKADLAGTNLEAVDI